MSRIGVSITKSISFRGAAQEFSNTYYYEIPVALNSAIGEQFIDYLVVEEKQIHATTVTFVRGRAWSAGGSNATNNMLHQKNLSGTGSATASSSTMPVDRERAVLVRFRAGSDSKGRPVYLRKWWHLDVFGLAGQSFSAAHLQQTSALSSAMRADAVDFADDIKTLALPAPASATAELVSPTGRAITGATECHPYLEHHQLGEMWR